MWIIDETDFNKDNIINNGNKFLIGNGFIGYRGTLEEFGKKELVAVNLPGVYDKYQDKWKESVNAPNPFFTQVIYNDKILNPLINKPVNHYQSLDISCGVFSRITAFKIDDATITLKSERFVSLKNIHLLSMKYEVISDMDITITLETGIDLNIWDINGPHLKEFQIINNKDCITAYTSTLEKQIPIVVSEATVFSEDLPENFIGNIRKINVRLKKDQSFYFYKYAYINHHEEDLINKAEKFLSEIVPLGYDHLFNENKNEWQKRWDISDVIIKGDDYAQLALRYSIYHLLILSQRHTDKVSIPARGISGQTYKGAVFWDTEMFMLPFYLNTDLITAKNLIKYRINTLEGARIKAKEYGYRGAFYAWESQENGMDACTHFNVTDVLTHRPMRTYFRDKQIHISADITYAIYQTYLRTKDISLIINGGAEVILECARFYLSYGYLKLDNNRFVLPDVTGPDEYHERVNNNAFTNRMVKETFKIALLILSLLKDKYPDYYENLLKSLNYAEDYEKIKYAYEHIYLQEPNEDKVIEQFDGYFRLEDVSIDILKKRLLHPNEYWGGENGVASHTQVIKQADVVTMLYLFKDDYNEEIRKANWHYYEQRTEHGSSLSACMYALVACLNNNPDWAYPFFMKSATIDMHGGSKQYAGDIYIGGTHPASSGGAYMTAIYGFAGISIYEDKIIVKPNLPKNWQGMTFKIIHDDHIMQIEINDGNVYMRRCNND